MFDSLMERFEALFGKKLRSARLTYVAGQNAMPHEVILAFEGGECVRFTAPADVDFAATLEEESHADPKA